ncbi:glycosyl hydrolase family 28 protein [Bifidobacterium biavatii]|uniref:Polygalacturonase Pgl28B n=1 Tax=Bifidobacterium biavatii DSM 23969 TaxID=1437608 RepID=A0A086ZXF7_9BIFI|nr:glycosyl hydrolase family 28 protein [Bifidobacterium biavatii]KFI51207.1 polygalacturonase Pgl28B [Bifidobacterium biavatii DSM 23969]
MAAATIPWFGHTVTEDTLTVFWEPPTDADPPTEYAVTLDGERLAVVEHTHCMFDDLTPDSAHHVRVDATDANGHVIAGFDLDTRTWPQRTIIDVTRPPYNAAGDGTTMDTHAIQRAIDDCGPNQAVLLPSGTFLTGALFLHDDMELRVAPGATLQGSADPADYLPMISSRFEGIEQQCHASLINIGTLDHTAGPTCRNITLRGGGAILGGGVTLAKAQTRSIRDRLITESGITNADAIDDAVFRSLTQRASRTRGRLVNISNGANVLIEDLTLGYAAAWNIHFIYSEHVVTHHCRIKSMGVWNGDGWDPDSSEHCTIFDCDFVTEDDMVAIKSGKNPEGNVINRPTRDIHVFDLRADGGHGIAIGSEMSGGVEHVRIWDCDMGKSNQGLEIKASAKRGGFVRDVTLSDCIASRILVHSYEYHNNDGEAAPTLPYYENIHFRRIRLLGRHYVWDHWEPCPPIEINGFDDENRTLRDITFDQVSVDGSR